MDSSDGAVRERRMLVMRNFVFGVEDSLVSTVGLLSGVAIAGTSRATIILTGMVLIFVEAFSMGMGTFLAEHSAAEYGGLPHDGRSGKNTFLAGTIMLASYFVSGFVPLAPYLFLEGSAAFGVSIAASLAALFALGGVSARVSKIGVMREAFRMLILGGAAVAVGVAVGALVQ